MIFKLLKGFLATAIFFSINVFADTTGSEAKDIFVEGLQLRKKIQRFYKEEPRLYSVPAFRDIQQWTLANQNYNARHGQMFFQISVTFPEHVHDNLLKRAYLKYLLKMNQLVTEIPDQVVLHMGMIEDEAFRNKSIREIRETLLGISKNNLNKWALMCDYIAQPVLALWFTSVVLEHLDKIGRLNNAKTWNQYKAKMHESEGLLDFKALRSSLAEDKYLPL